MNVRELIKLLREYGDDTLVLRTDNSGGYERVNTVRIENVVESFTPPETEFVPAELRPAFTALLLE